MPVSRRSFLRASALTAGFAAAGPLRAMEAMATPLSRVSTQAASLAPTGAGAPFEHVIVVMMENRSFDHLLGWLPGADGVQDGLVYTAKDGQQYPTFRLAGDFAGCSAEDPDHSYVGGLTQLNEGFLSTVGDANDQFPIGYYDKSDVGFRADLATSFTVPDRYFCSIMAETFPNRFYQHGARTDRLHNSGITNVVDPNGFPTIWDRLQPLGSTTGPTGRYYSTDEPFLGLWGQKYFLQNKVGTYPEFLAAAASGTLPNVSFVDPNFASEFAAGAGNDDHPRGDIRGGASFLQEVYTAVRSNAAAWAKTVLIINYDEWGGFFDHVVPPSVADDSTASQITVGAGPSASDRYAFDFRRLGFRVPCFVVSPFAPARVFHDNGAPFEHTSILKMIEWRWGLAPLTARDANARNLAEVLDLTSPVPPSLNALPPVAFTKFQGAPCNPSSAEYPHPAAIAPAAAVPEVPWGAALPVGALAVGGAALLHNRSRRERIVVQAPSDGS